MRILRRVVFSIFVVLYLILCPLTILYALGYLYRPGVEEGIVKTGLIYLATSPPGASIYVGNRRFRARTPAAIPNLLPGSYPVRVVLRNHWPWIRRVSVKPEEATAVEKILLLSREPETETLLDISFQDLLSLPGTPYLLLSRGPKLGDFFVYHWKKKLYRPLLPASSRFRNARVLSHFVVPKSSQLLFRVEIEGAKHFLRVHVRPSESQVENLTTLFPQMPSRVIWDPQQKNCLFVFRDGVLDRLHIPSRSMTPRFAEGVRGYGIHERKIYLLKDNFVLERRDLAGGSREILFDQPDLLAPLFGKEGSFEIKFLSKEILLFMGERRELLASRLPYRFFTEDTKGVALEEELERVLVWTSQKLGVLDFSRKHEEKGAFEEGPGFKWIFKEGRQLEQAFWVYEGSHVLFRDQETVFFSEFDTPGESLPVPLVRTRKGSSVFYSDETGKLYYLSPLDGHLSSLSILPARELSLLPEELVT